MTTQSSTQTQNNSQHLLLVEDDLNLGFLLMDFLEDEGFKTKLCRDGASGLEQFKKHDYDLCILDVMMPKMDGFELASKIKEEDKDARFIFLTAKVSKEDKCAGYELGAEDYVSKPFDQDELLYKIKAILRRTAAPRIIEKPSLYSIGEYTFDPGQLELTYRGESIRLTDKENSVLMLLCSNMNQILKRDDAVEVIYGKRDYFLGRSFDVFISRLRKHLSKDDQVSIENVYKVGFILSA